MKIRPAGHYVLVEVEPVEETSEGGIVIQTEDSMTREQGGRDIGTIIEFGPIAYKGFADCHGPRQWGVKEGDKVEFSRYDGKVPRLAEDNPDYANLRLICDNDIIAVMEVDSD